MIILSMILSIFSTSNIRIFKGSQGEHPKDICEKNNHKNVIGNIGMVSHLKSLLEKENLKNGYISTWEDSDQGFVFHHNGTIAPYDICTNQTHHVFCLVEKEKDADHVGKIVKEENEHIKKNLKTKAIEKSDDVFLDESSLNSNSSHNVTKKNESIIKESVNFLQQSKTFLQRVWELLIDSMRIDPEFNLYMNDGVHIPRKPLRPLQKNHSVKFNESDKENHNQETGENEKNEEISNISKKGIFKHKEKESLKKKQKISRNENERCLKKNNEHNIILSGVKKSKHNLNINDKQKKDEAVNNQNLLKNKDLNDIKGNKENIKDHKSKKKEEKKIKNEEGVLRKLIKMLKLDLF